MDSNGNIEKRLSTLEREVADLKRRIRAPSRDWLEESSGSLKDVPQEDFDKFVRYGEEFRRIQADAAD